VGGCSTTGDLYLRDELSNQGPISLSASNPFVAANLFVANEMKHSDVFRGFIKYRGTPDAVEVRKSTFKPLRVVLFYLGEAEAYMLEQGSGDWLVRGPDKIPPQFMTSFFNVTPAGPNAPLAYDFGYGNSTPAQRPIVESYEPAPPAAEVRSLRNVPTRNQLDTNPRSKNGATATEAAKGSRAGVEDTSSGDVIHRVSFPGETLRVITNWYTGDVNNTGRIARINGIENPDLLKIDQTVRIPRYLLKTTKPLPQSEISRMKALDHSPSETDLPSGS
jgi:hypothetical protein